MSFRGTEFQFSSVTRVCGALISSDRTDESRKAVDPEISTEQSRLDGCIEVCVWTRIEERAFPSRVNLGVVGTDVGRRRDRNDRRGGEVKVRDNAFGSH